VSVWKRGLLHGVQPDIIPLEPPATPTELKWWLAQRDAYKRRVFLRMGVPMFVVGMLTMLLTKPERFFTLAGLGTACFMLFLAVIGTYFHMRTQEKDERDKAIRWKRIRDDLRRSLTA
jgi:hypothetical protein